MATMAPAIATDLSRPAGYEWRPARLDDVPALHRMLLAVDAADDRSTAGVLEDMRREFDDPWSDPRTDSLLGLTADGEVAAMARVYHNPQPEAECRAHLAYDVHPRHRGRGLEAFVLDWAAARGRQVLQDMPAHLPRVLRTGIPVYLTHWATLLEARGFRPIRYFVRMRRDLSQPIPDLALPDGLTLRAFDLDRSDEARDAFNESFADHWGFEPVSADDWRVFFMQRSTFRPDLSCLAMDGERAAGFSINRVSPEEDQREGIRQGWIGQLGVRRAWRKRGVASALIAHSMRAFRSAGLDHATLGVDAENPTGALAVYERLGFVEVKRFVVFNRTVDG